MQTDSRGTGRATNNSTTYHYKGELWCVATCPGPQGSGCSATTTFTLPAELAPAGSVSCIMFATTDPCCQDDGEFFVGSKFTVTDYRAAATDPWSPLPAVAELSRSGLEQDAGPGNPQINPNENPSPGGLHLDVECVQPPGGLFEEAKVTLTNGSEKFMFKAKVRGQAVCPSQDGNQPYCYCISSCPADPNLACPPSDPNFPYCFCNNDPVTCPAPLPTCTLGGLPQIDRCRPYPRAMNLDSTSNIAAFTVEFTLGPGESTQALHNRFPGVIPRPAMVPLNSCCDCDAVASVIVCGESDATAVLKPNRPTNDFETLTSPAYDKKGTCKQGPGTPGVQYQCFGDLAAFCSDPI